jgi:hypothetical protein
MITEQLKAMVVKNKKAPTYTRACTRNKYYSEENKEIYSCFLVLPLR